MWQKQPLWDELVDDDGDDNNNGTDALIKYIDMTYWSDCTSNSLYIMAR